MANRHPIVLISGQSQEIPSADKLASSDIEGSPKVGYRDIAFDGMGAVIAVNSKAYFTIPKGASITGWAIIADGASPTCTLDVWKIASGTALPTVSNTIMGTKPALVTGNVLQSTTLTGWSVTVTANDIFCVNVDAITIATKLNFQLVFSFT